MVTILGWLIDQHMLVYISNGREKLKIQFDWERVSIENSQGGKQFPINLMG